MSNSKKDKKQAIIILLILLLTLLLGYYVIFIQNLTLFDLKEIFRISNWQLMNFVVMVIYIGFFGFLGYKKAIEKKVNYYFWATVCAILGVWGYLYLLFYKPKSN